MNNSKIPITLLSMNVDKMEETNELYNIINSKFCGYFSEFYEGNKRIVNKLNISRIINKNKKRMWLRKVVKDIGIILSQIC